MSKISIDPTAVVCSEALLKGKFPITIKGGTVIHPKAIIDAENGPIEIGSNNIIEELAVIKNILPKSQNEAPLLQIGNENLFECQSQIYCSVGDFNVFEIRSVVAEDLSDHIQIGHLNKFCVLAKLNRENFGQYQPIFEGAQTEIKQDSSVVIQTIFSASFVKNSLSQTKENYSALHKKQLVVLQGQLPKFHRLHK